MNGTMTLGPFVQYLILLGLAVAAVAAFQRLKIPSSLGYLLVGVIVGPHTAGLVIEGEPIGALANFGIVFLLFTIGLNFSLPQLHNMRRLLLPLGAGQVVLTTAVIAAATWFVGFPPAAAFVTGAVFAQSSTTILGRQLADQGEDKSNHGRLALAISVFQDITAVPFLIIIPLLGTAFAWGDLTFTLALSFAKALVALLSVFIVGRKLLRPLFYLVSNTHSIELFTLAVLFVSLAAAAITNVMGLSMPFGAFLAGMMLGETEFRHQVESVIRPFRDVLLGLFFVGVGMLFDPAAIRQIWPWALGGAVALLVTKTLVVRVIVGLAKVDANTAWRTGLLLAVGGEFGFALLAIALDGGALGERTAQVVLFSVLFSMVAGPALIKFNTGLGGWLAAVKPNPQEVESLRATVDSVQPLHGHVVICGYGRIGQNVARFLEAEGIAYVAADLEPTRVQQARTAGEPVYYGDAGERDILEALGIRSSRLVVVSHEDANAAMRTLESVRALRPNLPVMVRTRDETHVDSLRKAGATEVVPETLEAGLMIASQALLLLDVSPAKVMRRMQEQRSDRYRLLREYFTGDSPIAEALDENPANEQLRPVLIGDYSAAVGRPLSDFKFEDVVVAALVRGTERFLQPPPASRLERGDVVVLFGLAEKLKRAERELAG